MELYALYVHFPENVCRLFQNSRTPFFFSRNISGKTVLGTLSVFRKTGVNFEFLLVYMGIVG